MNHPKLTIKCLNCNKERSVYFADVQRGKGRYCNRKCWNIHKRKLPKYFTCKQCGKEKENIYSQRTKVFCSKNCQTEWQKGRLIPPNIQNKNGRKPRTYHLRQRDKHGSAEERDWRIKIFKRDGYTCQSCKKIGGKLQAHHIKPYKLFPEVRFEMTNGLTLCIECHKKTDSYGWQNYWKNHKLANNV